VYKNMYLNRSIWILQLTVPNMD